MNLWTFLTVVIIAWALVEIIGGQKKQKGNKKLEENYEALEERLEKMETRIRNLEAIVSDDDFKEAEGPVHQQKTPGESAAKTGRLQNKLK